MVAQRFDPNPLDVPPPIDGEIVEVVAELPCKKNCGKRHTGSVPISGGEKIVECSCGRCWQVKLADGKLRVQVLWD
jgi:hypothetical protein